MMCFPDYPMNVSHDLIATLWNELYNTPLLALKKSYTNFLQLYTKPDLKWSGALSQSLRRVTSVDFKDR